ncbi:MAG: hypothetical protein JXR84_14085 [Anaerolineae bacterium]|nr:hypothetical protein [Anaerolineae bacterium]
MTILDGLLIFVGVMVLVICALDGFLRAVVMLVSFYLLTTAVGLLTLATEAIRGVAVTLVGVLGGHVPDLIITQTLIFAVLTTLLFIGSYFLSKLIFRDTTLPKLQVLDNILGAIVGIVLASLIMAVIYNTWGVAVSVRWQNAQAWYNTWAAYSSSILRPYMREILLTYRPLYFMFRFIEYPPFFILQA